MQASTVQIEPAGNFNQAISVDSYMPALTELGREDIAIINNAMSEFFTPLRADYKGFAEDLMTGASQHMLASGLHATVWPASSPADVTSADSVLLVHGWGGNSAQLAGFVKPLLARGKRVVAIDMWAHGFSPGVESNCVKFAEGIAEAQAELGPFNHAIGHSLGAAAILVASYAGCKFDSAVLISPPSILLVMKKFITHKGAPHLLEPFIQMGERYVGKLRAQADSLLISKYVTMPFLLIHDQADKRCPISVSEELAMGAKNRSLIKTDGYGHNHIIGAAEVIAAAVDYVSEGG